MIGIQNWRLKNRGLEFFMRMGRISLLSTVGEVKESPLYFCCQDIFWLFWGFMGKERVRVFCCWSILRYIWQRWISYVWGTERDYLHICSFFSRAV